MRNQITASELNTATLAVDADQIIEAMSYYTPSGAAHLSERLFKLPLEELKVDGHRVFIANGLRMTVDTCVDFLQLIVGPTKIGRPIRCYIKRGHGWSPISVKEREVSTVVKEYFA